MVRPQLDESGGNRARKGAGVGRDPRYFDTWGGSGPARCQVIAQRCRHAHPDAGYPLIPAGHIMACFGQEKEGSQFVSENRDGLGEPAPITLLNRIDSIACYRKGAKPCSVPGRAVHAAAGQPIFFGCTGKCFASRKNEAGTTR